MLLQRGRFLANNIDELNSLNPDSKDGIKRVINLDYMGKIEYDGNTIPALRMMMELHREDYHFYQLPIFNANNEQMIIYMNFEDKSDENKNTENAKKIALKDTEKNYSLYEHIKLPDEATTNFWWDIEYNYMIFFGNDKIDVINYFIDSCFTRDGGKEEIAKKLVKDGCKF
jgi:hypothetical protein